jgi:hypothetical protein
MRQLDGREQLHEVLEHLSGEPLAAGFNKRDRALCGVDSPLRGFIADASFATACFLSPFLESRHASILLLIEARRETGRAGSVSFGVGEQVLSKKPPLVILSPPGEPSVIFPMTEGSHFVSDLPAQEALAPPQKE